MRGNLSWSDQSNILFPISWILTLMSSIISISQPESSCRSLFAKCSGTSISENKLCRNLNNLNWKKNKLMSWKNKSEKAKKINSTINWRNKMTKTRTFKIKCQSMSNNLLIKNLHIFYNAVYYVNPPLVPNNVLKLQKKIISFH